MNDIQFILKIETEAGGFSVPMYFSAHEWFDDNSGDIPAVHYTDLGFDNRQKTIKQPKKQDIVQPTLFTESVMREQERPIVTANDQLIQRIEALEARLNKITTLFQNL